DEEGRWRTRRRVDQLGIPEGVREVISRRLARLSSEANRVLSSASVVGRDFDVQVVSRLIDEPIDSVLDGLDEATSAGVVSELGHRPGHYGFTHALVRQTLYEQLSLTRRVLWHGRVAEALEGLHGRDIDAHLSQLAHHYSQAAAGGHADKAVEYCRRAGEADMATFAYEAAAGHFGVALEVAEEWLDDAAVRGPLLLAKGWA